jgi:hypothetical protein
MEHEQQVPNMELCPLCVKRLQHYSGHWESVLDWCPEYLYCEHNDCPNNAGYDYDGTILFELR